VAFVVPERDGVEPGLLVAVVRDHCERNLGRIKRPSQIRIVDVLPRSATGKLLRRALRELASA
jgi:acyl-coenzyme A synthetase/AMP-(fatty) acid ligase